MWVTHDDEIDTAENKGVRSEQGSPRPPLYGCCKHASKCSTGKRAAAASWGTPNATSRNKDSSANVIKYCQIGEML